MTVCAGFFGVHESICAYILKERPGCVVVFSERPIEFRWPKPDEAPPVFHFSEYSEFDVSDIIAPAIAILQLDDQADSFDQVLGWTMRQFPTQVLVCLDSRITPDQTLFAFGFNRLTLVESVVAPCQTRWFEYRLSKYKQSPDWLNARFWANPHRFDADDEHDVYIDAEDEEE